MSLERDCWKLAALALRRQLDDFETDAETDERLLKHQRDSLSKREHMAVVLRLGEKRALLSALDRVNKRVQQIEQKTEL